MNGADISGGLDACWEWQGRRQPDGYGLFGSAKAHRASFAAFNGEIPSRYEVRHTCDNPPCVNPRHLIVGTHGDNMRDMADRLRTTHRLLDEGIVLTLHDAGIRTSRIAVALRCSYTAVKRVLVRNGRGLFPVGRPRVE